MQHQAIVYLDLGVGGMTCDDCVVKVTEALESVRGVADAVVRLEDRSAVVTAAPEVSTEALTGAVRLRGYNAFVRSRRDA